MNDELVKRLRELQFLTEHCREQTCFECENIKLCDKHDNKTINETYKQAADAIENTSKAYQMMAEAYEAEVTKQGWIPVTERCPEKSGDYLVFDDCRNLYVNEWHYLLKKWQYDDSRVTHWMPLPEPPKEESYGV